MLGSDLTSSDYPTARRWATHLIEWGYSEVKIVEDVSTGTLIITYRDRCGVPRTIRRLD